MDTAVLNKLKRVYNKFSNNTFDGSDVCYFFIVIREYSRKSSLREIADFFAHRERDRGKTFEYMNEHIDIFYQIVYGQVRDNLKPPPSSRITSIDLNGIYDTDIIRNDINNIFVSNGMNRLADHIINDIMLYVFIELIGCNIIDNGKNIIGTLGLGFVGDDIHLDGNMVFKKNNKELTISIPVYIIQNRYTEIKFPQTETGKFICGIPLPENAVYELKRNNDGRIVIFCNSFAL